MIKVHCDNCGVELTETGAILLSHPDVQGKSGKYHLCRTCEAFYLGIMETIRKNLRVQEQQELTDRGRLNG